MSKKMIYIITIVILILAILVITMLTSDNGKANYIKITGEEAEALINEGAEIVDVRTNSEYMEKHIKEATNLPLDQIETISLDKDQAIIVYCRSGSRSKEAANKLISMGYQKVYDLGSINNWTGEFE